MSTKTKKAKRRSPATVSTFDADHFVEIIDTPQPLPASTNHKSGDIKKKNALAPVDRRRLKDIEIWLNNCVNAAQAIDAKMASVKIVQLLRDARAQVQQLRG